MNQRYIVLDTETTGLKPSDGHRIIEIGCIEIINRRVQQDSNFHFYLNPDRMIDPGAQAVHGLSNEFLADKPHFSEIVADFIAFIEGAHLIIHNAPFDVGFLEHELRLCHYPKPKIHDHVNVIDTLVMARRKHPGQRNSLDALCKRYDINNTHRKLHGALLDSEILAHVYLAMTGGQGQLFQEDTLTNASSTMQKASITRIDANRPQLRVIKATADECKAHEEYLESF